MKKIKLMIVGAILSVFASMNVASAAQSLTIYNADGNPLATVATFAGQGDFGQTDGAALSAMFRAPQGIAVMADGTVLVSDTQSHLIRQISNGQVSTFAGITLDNNDLGLPQGGLSNGEKSTAVFQLPKGLAVDSAGNILVADAGNNTIRKIDKEGRVTIFAGHPEGFPGLADGRGDDVRFNHPSDVAVTPNGVVYVADTLNHVIRKISTLGFVSTLNASSERVVEVFDGVIETAGDFKDGKISEALFNEPTALAVDAKGNLYVSDTGNQRIRYIDFAAGMVTTVAGSKDVAYEDGALYAETDYVNGEADKAWFNFPKGLALTAEGGLLIADSQNNAVRYLYNNKVTTLAGSLEGTSGDRNGTERRAMLHNPTSVALDASGNILAADAYNNKIRKISNYQLPANLPKDGNIHVVSNSKVIAFDAMPRNVNGRVMVLVRAIAEALGYEVQALTSTDIIVVKGETTFELKIGGLEIKKTADSGIQTTTMDIAPFIEQDRTYVPVRFLSEQLGLQVDWSQEDQTVIIRE